MNIFDKFDEQFDSFLMRVFDKAAWHLETPSIKDTAASSSVGVTSEYADGKWKHSYYVDGHEVDFGNPDDVKRLQEGLGDIISENSKPGYLADIEARVQNALPAPEETQIVDETDDMYRDIAQSYIQDRFGDLPDDDKRVAAVDILADFHKWLDEED